MSLDTFSTLVIPTPAYNILRRLTGESRPDVALNLALKDLVRLRLEAAQQSVTQFEQKYGTPFAKFQEKWHTGQVPETHSYSVEQDYLTWEAAETDIQALEELSQFIP